MEGWVKIHKKMLDWEWSDNPNTGWLFITLLLLANHEDTTWKGVEVKRGQLVTGRHKLSVQTGLSEREVRTALNNLQTTNEITIKTTNKYSIISICKYDSYQSNIFEADQQNDQLPSQQNDQRNDHIQEEKNNIIYLSSPSTACTREREIPVGEIKQYIDGLRGTQQYESMWMEIFRICGGKASITTIDFYRYIDLFIDELSIQGIATHKENDICRHFIQWARIAIPKINRSNGDTKRITRQDVIDSYEASIKAQLGGGR